MKLSRILPTSLLGVAGLTLVGLVGMQTPAIGADEAKREDDTTEIVLVADDDDDDTFDDPDDGDDGDDADSKVSNDNTRSNVTAVSRDRDQSRGDKTRDWTRDGKSDKKKRDWSANKTNDRSRNDTRG